MFFTEPNDYGLTFNNKCDQVREIVTILREKSKVFGNIDFKLEPNDNWDKVEKMFKVLSEG